MSDLSNKTLISSGDTKNYIENYWTKRADAFATLRRQELHSEKYSPVSYTHLTLPTTPYV